MNHLKQDILTISLATVRALAQDAKLQVKIGGVSSQTSPGIIRLTDIPNLADRQSVSNFRALRDSPALRIRYSDVAIEARHQPNHPFAQSIYLILEQVRCETLGLRNFFGVALDLSSQLDRSLTTSSNGFANKSNVQHIQDAVTYLARCSFYGVPLSPEINSTLNLGVYQSTEELTGQLHELSKLLLDQEAFALQAASFAEHFTKRLESSSPKESTKKSKNEKGETDEQQNNEQKNKDLAPREETQERSNYKQLLRAWQTASPRLVTHLPQPGKELEYRVYTREYDQIIEARRLPKNGEEKWQNQVNQVLSKLPIGVVRAASRLRRYLLAQHQRDWQYDLEEGMLDPRRVTRLVTQPFDAAIFKREHAARYPDTVVSILVDNSGSMRNESILMAAASVTLLGELLERCSINSEVLGFTTRDWRGGNPRKSWASSGRPADPGRLNATRHIIYKSAGESWRRARSNVSRMMDPDILKENIDGEALQWATSRLVRRAEQRRILMVISDGAPLDDATLRANDNSYLDRHLRQVIADIESRNQVELLAIGIRHDVTPYYQRAITLNSVDDLIETMHTQLLQLIKELEN